MGACEAEAAQWVISDSISTSPLDDLNYCWLKSFGTKLSSLLLEFLTKMESMMGLDESLGTVGICHN